jgi:glycosyltransferase involved in cell wall biosynthesis
MKVSIITPTYNRAHTIIRSVESVLAQTHSGWELIIRDDGSKDNTAQVLAPYLADARIRYLPRAENKGVNTTRNEAMDAISDDVQVVTFLDSDDTLVPDALEKALAVMASEPQYSWFNFPAKDEAGNTRTHLSSPDLIGTPDVFIKGTDIGGEFVQFLRRDCANSLRFIDGINGYEGIGWIRLAQSFPCRFRPEPLRVYWQDTESLIRVGVKSRRYYDNQARGLALFMDEFGTRLTELNPQGAALNWLVLSHAQAMLGQCADAWLSSLRGIALNPLDLRVLRNGLSLMKCLFGLGLAK